MKPMTAQRKAKALKALREAPDEIRLQGQAFSHGKMCACSVVVNALAPGQIDFSGDSVEDRFGAARLYGLVDDLIGTWRHLARLNDEMNGDQPAYTFAQLADAMEQEW